MYVYVCMYECTEAREINILVIFGGGGGGGTVYLYAEIMHDDNMNLYSLLIFHNVIFHSDLPKYFNTWTKLTYS